MLAFEHFLVVAFRDQDLTPEEHKAFSRRFGEIMELPQAPTYNGYSDMQEARREAHEPENVVPSFEHFHTDSPFLTRPPGFILMRALAVPRFGGDTAFSNAYLVYEQLSPGMPRSERVRMSQSSRRESCWPRATPAASRTS